MVVMARHVMSHHVMSWIDAPRSFRSNFVHEVTPIRTQWIRLLDRMGSSPVWSSSAIKMRMTGSQLIPVQMVVSRLSMGLFDRDSLALAIAPHQLLTSQSTHGQGASQIGFLD